LVAGEERSISDLQQQFRECLVEDISMASAKDLLALYLATADSDPVEAKANADELSRRTSNSLRSLIIGIQSRELKLLEFVRLLGEYLTHEEPRIRTNGTAETFLRLMVALGCLSGVIASFPPKTMSIQEVDVMTTFYCDRMEDEVSIKDNITGLSALQGMTGFGEEEVTKVCDAYDCKGLQ
jgi:DNA repair/transcription protein MET18/MMS19